MPKVSVIIPVYNSEEHLSECIESVLHQTFVDFELILVDDGSKDSSGSICDGYKQKDQRIVVIHKPNGGVSSARNAGLEAAQGECVAFVDSDDSIECRFLQDMIEKIEQEQAAMAISGISMEFWKDGRIVRKDVYKGENRIYTPRTLLEGIAVDFAQICISGPSCKLYLRNVICKADLRFNENLHLGEDTYFNMDYLDALDDSEKIVFAENVYYHYRRENEESLYSGYSPDYYQVINAVSGKMCDVCSKKQCSEQTADRFENMYLQGLIGCIHHEFLHYEKTTTSHIYAVIRQVENHNLLREHDCLNKTGWKSALIMYLLKRKWIHATYLLFFLFYKILR